MNTFTAQQYLNTSLEQAWDFFSSPNNLQRITPPAMDFQIVNDDIPKEIYKGLIIDYTVKPLFGIRMKWKSEITDVEKLQHFVDTQISGPYKQWIHRHRFEEVDNGVMMYDDILYEVPFAGLGKIMNSLLIQSKINDIFEYRRKMIHTIFNSDPINF